MLLYCFITRQTNKPFPPQQYCMGTLLYTGSLLTCINCPSGVGAVSGRHPLLPANLCVYLYYRPAGVGAVCGRHPLLPANLCLLVLSPGRCWCRVWSSSSVTC